VRAADMTIEDDIAFLERIPSFALLGRPALRILAMGAESRLLQSGEILFHVGEKADGGFIVQQGSLALTPDTSGNRAQEVIVGPATLLGELSLLIESVRPWTATAIERTSVIRISRSLFLKMLEGFPDAARRLRDYIGARSDQAARELVDVRVNLDPPGPGR
jgi:CRP-like cAMP-binding protein